MPYLVLRVKKLQLVVHEAVLGGLLLAQGPFLLELGAPESLDAVHAGTQLLVRELELLFEVGQFALQVIVLGLQLVDVHATGVPHTRRHQVRVGRLSRRPGAI